MSYVLSDDEVGVLQDRIQRMADRIKFMIYKKAVILYVETQHLGFQYPVCMGEYDSPEIVFAALAAHEIYLRHLWTRRDYQVGPMPSQEHITSECDFAISQWRTKNGINS